jgi:hypothetical protein
MECFLYNWANERNALENYQSMKIDLRSVAIKFEEIIFVLLFETTTNRTC